MSTKLKIANIYWVGIVLTTSLFSNTIARSQPIPDETLPNNSEVNLEGSTYQIDGGTVTGNNLFHSFEAFSVPTGTEALFNNNLAIQNIISRVTGNSISNIDGELGAMGNANLFFLNPNGVIFGPNSSLNIGGSFITTTADNLQFEDGKEFSPSNPQGAPLLTISTPVGLQFGNQVGDITNQSGELFLNSGSTFALIGGKINLEGGTIVSFPGNIEIGSVTKNSQVNLIPIEEGWTFDYGSVENFQEINLTQARNAADQESDFPVILSSVKMQIQGKNMIIRDGKQISIGENLQINTSDTLKITGSAPSSFEDSIFNSGLVSNAIFDNDGGDIVVNTGRLLIENGGQILSQVTGTDLENTGELIPDTGNGGDITINATELIELTDELSLISSSTSGFGSAGNITINTKDLVVENGAKISAESTGELSERPLATGLGGEIEINASESIGLNGGIISSSTSGLGDNAGGLGLETNQLSVLESSEISVSASGSGLAGNLEITANSIKLDRSSLNAETRVGDQGNIVLSNANTLLLSNNSQITTNATDSATGGDISITSDGISLLDNSDITANAVQGQGGSIQITTQGIFQEPDSQITATSELGIDGTITINSPDVDPTSGIFELPDVPIDAERILAQDLCKLSNDKIAKGSSFIITGRGGLIPTSESSLVNRDRIVNWASREDLEVSNNGTVGIRHREIKDIPDKSYADLQQSQGLIVAADGSTWLTANVPNAVPQNATTEHPDCQASQK